MWSSSRALAGTEWGTWFNTLADHTNRWPSISDHPPQAFSVHEIASDDRCTQEAFPLPDEGGATRANTDSERRARRSSGVAEVAPVWRSLAAVKKGRVPGERGRSRW